MVRPLGAQTLELENCNGNCGDPGWNPISRLILFQVSFHLLNMIANCEDHWFYPSHFNSLYKWLAITSIDDFFPLYLIWLHVLIYLSLTVWMKLSWSKGSCNASRYSPLYYRSPQKLPFHDWAEWKQTNRPQQSTLVEHAPPLGVHGFGSQRPLVQAKRKPQHSLVGSQLWYFVRHQK